MSAEAERWREVRHWAEHGAMEAGDALLAANERLERESAHLTKVATEYQSRIAELEAGLRVLADEHLSAETCWHIARDLLAGQTDGGGA